MLQPGFQVIKDTIDNSRKLPESVPAFRQGKRVPTIPDFPMSDVSLSI